MAGEMASVRRNYEVPAYRGRKVTFLGYSTPLRGEIMSSTGSHLWLRINGMRMGPFHPTWKIDYHDGRGDMSRRPTPMDRAWAASPRLQDTNEETP